MSFENFCQVCDNFFVAVKFIHYCTIFKKKYKSKRSIKSQPVRYMCHDDTCVPHGIRDE